MTQLEKILNIVYYKSKGNNKDIIKNENIVIYSDYNFYSISLLLLLSEYPINIVPIVKTTEKEFSDKISSFNPHKIISFDERGSLIVENLNSISTIIDQNHENVIIS